jgi:1-phosphofructokinase
VIVTVTANPAVDKRFVIPGFRTGAMNRAAVERVEIGGKGINVSQNLAQLGCEVLATGFLGAAEPHDLAAALATQRVQHDFVHVPGEVRTNLKILDPVSGLETEINEAGSVVPPAAIEALTAKLRVLARHCTVMVFSGSLPPGAPEDLYARYIEIASAAGVRTVLDTAGAPLACGIGASPDLVKPNRGEAEELLGLPIRHDRDLAAAARSLLERGPRAVVISLGAGGAVGASQEALWRATPPAVLARSTVGAGDAMVAGLAYALERSLSPADALRLGIALGTAAAASGTVVPAADDVQRLLAHVLVEPIAPSVAPIDLRGAGA